MERRGAKPGERRGGRKAGTPNRIPSIKEKILACYDTIGGDAAFAEWAKKNPTVFYSNLWKYLIPKELEAVDENGTIGPIRIIRVITNGPEIPVTATLPPIPLNGHSNGSSG